MDCSLSARLRILAAAANLGLLACGGSVDNQSSSPAGTAGQGNGGSNTDSQLLADCTPGFPKSEASSSKPCYFLNADICYSTQDAACACICPRDQGPVVCASGYDSVYVAGGQVMWVMCGPP